MSTPRTIPPLYSFTILADSNQNPLRPVSQSPSFASLRADANVSPDDAPMVSELANIPCCPVCGAALVEIRAKYHCSRCHRICETCCEGGRG
ncbi:MAG: hypothetical protein ACKO3V_00665 [Pirellula sp.]